MEMLWWQIVLVTALTAVLGGLVGWALAGSRAGVAHARLGAERDGLARQVGQLEEALSQDREAAAALAPLSQTLRRVEEQVRVLERDRVEHFGQVGSRLSDVAEQTRALQQQTAALAGALNSSGTRGTWGEVQLRRVLEHAGMLERCDFDEQVSARTRHDARVRPDAVVHLPGGKSLVIDSKAPLSAFLRAQADDLSGEEVAGWLRRHAAALRGHVETLAGKDYWSAFRSSPELVICFVPSDAVLAAALRAEPDLYDHAQSRHVVLASPGTLLAMLRATALAWQQDSLTSNAQELLALGAELHQRLGTLGRHVTTMGASLRRSVESYNSLVGTLESRVLVTSRRMQELGLAESAPDPLPLLQAAPRPLTSPELLAAELHDLTPQRPALLDEQAPRDDRGRGAEAG